MNIAELLAFSILNKASDLHLSAGLPPLLRVDGEIVKTDLPALSHKDVHALLYNVMNDAQRLHYDTHLECDFSFTARDTPDMAAADTAENTDTDAPARFRVNAFNQQRGAAAVFRHIAATVPTLEQLGCPALFGQLALKQNGLVLVTGPTGSGKSTTLAAMIDHINRRRSAHVITIEDPIEFIHRPLSSLINQREAGRHTACFAAALRSALRADPDVIMVGELRDLDSIRLALSAAETGHLVLATLHTGSAVKSVDRLVDAFPGPEKDMVRTMLSESLQGVISQLLVRRSGSAGANAGSGRIAAYEIMLGTPAIRNLIREGKVAQMYSALQTGGSLGMQTLDQHLAKLVQQQAIPAETARAVARHPDNFPI
ncbi:type IV pilus twitching motility protein PilT [Oxalobacteraceae bacterium CAVE-383]|nr:type IV pilus twitching motility protein PilT [Oxalobacteraceae bacterium CAVE-383]